MINSLEVASDGAIWMNGWEGRQGSFYVARFDTSAGLAQVRQSAPNEAWTIYTEDDGLVSNYISPIAFGPKDEIWFGPTRFQPTQTEGTLPTR